MSGTPERTERTEPSWPARALRALAEVGLLSAAALDALTSATGARIDGWGTGAAALALVGLLLRRRLPLLGFALTLPSLAVSYALVATVLALYELSRRTAALRLPLAGAVVTAVVAALPSPPSPGALAALVSGGPRDLLLNLVYGALAGAAPVAVGRLAQARVELRHQLVALEAAHCAERRMREVQVLERERLRLAREMHDVVSHQVSLIAVQAGAMQLTGPDEATRASARTIRELGVATLDELRHMVGVLRAAQHDGAPLEPQPRLEDLPRLVEAAGCGASLEVEQHLVLDPPTERAVYRTVQEGLTNARKHAPGAPVAVRVAQERAAEGTWLVVGVVNGPREGQPLGLPSSQLGLVGLRERAELLRGELVAGPDGGGGYRLELRVPVSGS